MQIHIHLVLGILRDRKKPGYFLTKDFPNGDIYLDSKSNYKNLSRNFTIAFFALDEAVMEFKRMGE